MHSSFRVIACLGHHHEPDVVGLCLMFARRGHREDEVDERGGKGEGHVKSDEGAKAEEHERSVGEAFTESIC